MTGRFRILLTGSLIGLSTYVVAYLIVPDRFVPQEFLEARIAGAEVAKKIVDHSKESLENLEVIAYFDRIGNAPAALTLITQELGKSREVHGEAIILAAELEKMSRYLAEIEPTRGRLLATEAVSSEVALVSRLLQYNDYLTQLFGALRVKFEEPDRHTNGTVEKLIEKVNGEVKAINDLNERFTQSLAEFDKIF